jgi:hypothetical protein
LSAGAKDVNSFFGDEFKMYLMLNMASNSGILGKKAMANKLSNQADSFLKEGSMNHRNWCIRIFRAAMALSLNKAAEA